MLRAISLHQPWASLMACHAKTIETRHYLTHCTGLLAIHAAQKIVKVPDPTAKIMLHALDPKATPLSPQDYFDGLVRGVIVAVVEIYDCSRVEHFQAQHNEWFHSERHFGDFSNGRFAWFTRKPVTLKEPVECKGKQGFFFLPADVEAKVRAQL